MQKLLSDPPWASYLILLPLLSLPHRSGEPQRWNLPPLSWQKAWEGSRARFHYDKRQNNEIKLEAISALHKSAYSKILKTKEVQGKPITIGKEEKSVSGLELLLFHNSELKYFNSSTARAVETAKAGKGHWMWKFPECSEFRECHHCRAELPPVAVRAAAAGLSGAAVCRCSQGDVVASQRENATWQGEDAEEIQTVFQYSGS